MPIPFNPPQGLIEAYLARKSTGQQVLDSGLQAAQAYAQIKQQQQAQDLAKQQLASLEASRKANEFKAVADYLPENQIPGVAEQYGIHIPGAVQSTPAMAPVAAAPEANYSSGPASGPQNVDPSGSPILAHWNATGGIGGQAPAPAASPGGIPPMGPRPTSKAGLEKYQKNLQMTKTESDLAPKMPITKEGLLSSGNAFDPTSQMIVEPPTKVEVGTKEDQFYQKEWDKLLKESDPLNASSRTPLGLAARGTFQANRALQTLSKPIVTNQEAGNAMADIAAIYQGGSPTQFGMSHQQYNTIYGNVQNMLQSITGKPQDALPDAIKQRLVGVLTDMKGTNQALLKQRLDLTERSKSKVISRFPDEWKSYRQTLEGDSENYSGLASTASPATLPTVSSDAQFNALPSGSSFKDPTGQVHRKK